jgi:hypothetical protein
MTLQVDMFSESDPYIRLMLPGQTDALQTTAIQDEANPWWDEDFFFDCIGMDERLEGEVRLELWDENEGRTADILIGSCLLDLGAYSSDEWPEIELPVILEPKWQKVLDEARRPKKGWLGFGGKSLTEEEKEVQEVKLRDPTLTVSIVGSVPSFQSLVDQLSEMDSVIIDKDTMSLRVPLVDPKLDGSLSLFVGLGFSNIEGLRLIMSTASQDSPYFIDFNVSSKMYGGQEGKQGDGSIKLERLKWPKGRKVAPRLKIYEELRLRGLPLSVDLQEITVQITPKLPAEAQFSVAQLLEWGGFSGPGATFNKAMKQMTANGALASSKRQEIYLAPDHEWPPMCLLGLDWKLAEDTLQGICPGLVAYVLNSKGMQNLNWEFSFQSLSSSAEYSVECFSKPIKLNMGDKKLKCKKMLHLADPGGRLRCDEALGGLCLVGFGLDQSSRSYFFLRALLGQDCGNNDELSPRGQRSSEDRSSISQGLGKGLGIIGSGLTVGLSKAGSTIKSVLTGGAGLLSRRKEGQGGGDSYSSPADSPSTGAVASKLKTVLSIGRGAGKKRGKKEVIEEEEEDY